MASQQIETLDLPQIYQKPPYGSLTSTLNLLTLQPPIWSHSASRHEILSTQESLASQRRGDITRYLSQIIKSPLEWLGDEEREEVWELASKRMSERCGRTAMGELIRKWPFVDSKGVEIEVVIREPALTGDSLGFKTWGSSYVLSRHLPTLRSTGLSGFFVNDNRPRVLELGSGTGLLGLAAAALWGVPITLSDLPNIVPNLRANAASNESLVSERGGSLRVGALTWGGEKDEEVFDGERFPIVLVADPLYDDVHPGLLASAIDENLQLSQHSNGNSAAKPSSAATAAPRAVVMVPLRDGATERLKSEFVSAMAERKLAVVDDGLLDGEDDWDNGGAVKCWLGIFGRES